MTMDLYVYFIVCPLVFLAGFVDAIAGGGGLITLPAYFISGLPTHVALGTNKMSSSLGTALTTYRYARLGYINFKRAILAVICAFVGSAIGAKLALLVPETAFKIALLFVLPLTALYLFRKKNFGESNKAQPKEIYVILGCALVSLLLGIYDGIYGPGTGTFLIIGFCTIAHCTIKESNGIAKAVNLSTDIAAFFIFFIHDSVCLQLGLIAGLFSIFGNYAGAKFFEKKGALKTKPIMICVIILFMIKVIYDLL